MNQSAERFDVVHASAFPYTWPIVCGLRLARRLKVPFFLTPFMHLGNPDDPDDAVRRAYTRPELCGLLRAAEALKSVPAERRTLRMTRPDSAGIPFLNVLNPFGLTGSPRDRMLQLEATQLAQRWQAEDGSENPFETVVPDPDRDERSVSPHQVHKFLEALAAHPDASAPLKREPAAGSPRLNRIGISAIPAARRKSGRYLHYTAGGAATIE